jgi:hypothetical protein
MTATGRDAPETPDSPLYGDSEAVAASSVPIPSLRVLQAAGAVRAKKEPKHHGGFRRMWPELEVLKAAAAAAIGEHFAWNIRMVAETMAKTRPAFWDAMALLAISDLKEAKPRKTLVMAEDHDWLLELIDRRFLFAKVPEVLKLESPDQPRIGNTLLGVARAEGGFQPIPWEFGTIPGRRALKKAAGEDAFRSAEEFYRLSLVAYDNFLSKATVNVSMQMRMAWHRLRGDQAHFLQEALHLKKRSSDG